MIAVDVIALDARRLDDFEAQEFSHEPFDDQVLIGCRHIQCDTRTLRDVLRNRRVKDQEAICLGNFGVIEIDAQGDDRLHDIRARDWERGIRLNRVGGTRADDSTVIDGDIIVSVILDHDGRG